MAVSVLFMGTAFSQNEVDALRYSQNFYSGSTRFTSMGGAFGALGGDFGSLSINPAGIGIYRSSEFLFTPSFSYHGTSSNYLSTNLSDYKYRMNFENVGTVFTYKSNEEVGWVTASFAFGYNRINDFSRSVMIEGINNKGSITDYFANLANGLPSSQFNSYNEGLAWETYLIDPTTNNQYQSAFAGDYGETQTKIINSKGGMGEYTINFGGNYSNVFYLGGGIGIQSVRYIENTDYQELDPKDSIANFSSMLYHTDLKTSGTGFNFKLGAIIRPIEWMRVGMAIHTPTFFQLHDEYSSSMKSSISDTVYTYSSPLGSYDYELTTPFRAIGSLGFVFKKVASLGIDYEFVDYSIARLRATDYMFRVENNTIETAYQATGNIRVGGEYRVGPFALRLGYAYYNSPFKTGYANADSHTYAYSGGFGIRNENTYFDMGFRMIKNNEKYYIYDTSVTPVEATDIKNFSYTISATLGFKF